MRDQFTHVVAFSQIANGCAVQVLNQARHGLDIHVRLNPQGPDQPIPVDFVAVDFVLHGGEVVKITHRKDRTLTSHHITNFFPGCVTLSKQLLGVAEWIFTPKQFHSWLLEHGGEPLTDDKLDQEVERLVGRPVARDEYVNVFRYLKRRA
jgi:hypothetical protein